MVVISLETVRYTCRERLKVAYNKSNHSAICLPGCCVNKCKIDISYCTANRISYFLFFPISACDTHFPPPPRRVLSSTQPKADSYIHIKFYSHTIIDYSFAAISMYTPTAPMLLSTLSFNHNLMLLSSLSRFYMASRVHIQ